jgi:hypothetical protein
LSHAVQTCVGCNRLRAEVARLRDKLGRAQVDAEASGAALTLQDKREQRLKDVVRALVKEARSSDVHGWATWKPLIREAVSALVDAEGA